VVPEFEPAWPPDGQRLAFLTGGACGTGNWDIGTADRDGRRTAVLASTDFSETGPTWSPDGQWIAYDKSPIPPVFDQIWVMRADGSDQHALTAVGTTDWSASWSPLGDDIAFLRRSSDAVCNVWLMSPSGHHQRDLTGDFADDCGEAGTSFQREGSTGPDWSPDGTHVVYSSNKSGNDEIYVIDVATRHVDQVTHNPARDVSPSWSSNGRWIVFESDRDGRNELFKIHPDGSAERQLTDAPTGYDGQPDWAPSVHG
jgi:Tol biopolymer transport system component